MSNGGRVLIDSLIALGASKSFGVPGESYLAALDAMHDTVGVFDFVLCRNESGASFMAAAYGKLNRTPGICFVTRGPGATHASIGVHTAMQDSAPMLLFVGQVGTPHKGREAFQEIDYRAVFGSMAKWAVEIDHVDRIPEILSRAWSLACSGRPGPVVIALPEDVLSSRCSAEPLVAPVVVEEPEPGCTPMARVGELLSGAQRPLIVYGGGGWSESGASALQAFAEASNIPVASAFRYQDIYDNFSPTYVGELGVATAPYLTSLVNEADVILAINIRFGEMTTSGYTLLTVPVPRQTLIHVHASDAEIGKIYVPDLALQAGPNAFAQKLAPVQGDWQAWCSAGRVSYEQSFELAASPSMVDMVAVCAWLRERLPDDTIVTSGAGNFTLWPNKFIQYGKRARLLAPQSGAMGYGVSAAIAAKASFPERTVICFAGDGDFQMSCQELGTAMQAGLQPIILLLNNGMYGTIRAHQERHYPTRVSGTTMKNPDFLMLAKSYGFYAERVEKTEAFSAAFERALDSTTGALLDLSICPEAISPHQSLSQLREAALNQRGG